MYESTPAQAREAFRALTVGMRAPESVVEVASVTDTTVAGDAGPLPARVYRPGGSDQATIAFFHGGGFVIGDIETHDNDCRALARATGAVVVSVDYRLAPEHVFPAAALDAIAATRDIAARLGEFGGSDVLAVAGDSAGGNLSAVAAQQIPGVAAQFLIYPATDVPGEYASREENAMGYFLDEPTLLWFIGHYAEADVDPTDPRLSPMYGELAGLPPAVIVTAGFDPLRDEGAAYAAALQKAGVRVEYRNYPDMIHGFIDMVAFSKAAQAATDDAMSLFASVLGAVRADSVRNDDQFAADGSPANVT